MQRGKEQSPAPASQPWIIAEAAGIPTRRDARVLMDFDETLSLGDNWQGIIKQHTPPEDAIICQQQPTRRRKKADPEVISVMNIPLLNSLLTHGLKKISIFSNKIFFNLKDADSFIGPMMQAVQTLKQYGFEVESVVTPLDFFFDFIFDENGSLIPSNVDLMNDFLDKIGYALLVALQKNPTKEKKQEALTAINKAIAQDKRFKIIRDHFLAAKPGAAFNFFSGLCGRNPAEIAEHFCGLDYEGQKALESLEYLTTCFSLGRDKQAMYYNAVAVYPEPKIVLCDDSSEILTAVAEANKELGSGIELPRFVPEKIKCTSRRALLTVQVPEHEHGARTPAKPQSYYDECLETGGYIRLDEKRGARNRAIAVGVVVAIVSILVGAAITGLTLGLGAPLGIAIAVGGAVVGAGIGIGAGCSVAIGLGVGSADVYAKSADMYVNAETRSHKYAPHQSPTTQPPSPPLPPTTVLEDGQQRGDGLRHRHSEGKQPAQDDDAVSQKTQLISSAHSSTSLQVSYDVS
jgi:hypothetical protein